MRMTRKLAVVFLATAAAGLGSIEASALPRCRAPVEGFATATGIFGAGSAKALGLSAERYRGESAEGQPIALEWLAAEGLPAYYRTGPAKPKAGDAGAYELKLVKLERVPAAQAFTAAYKPLLAMSDAGEDPLTGSLLSAEIGKGRHTHTSLVLHHQLDKLVPGAFRLLANLTQAAQR